MLFIGQLLVGVGVGIDFPRVAVMFRKSCRNTVAANDGPSIACESVGMLLAAVVALLLLKNVHSVQTWRLFLATEGVIALLFFLLRLRNQTVRTG